MALSLKENDCKCCSLKLNLFKYLTAEELEKINSSRFEVFFNPGETIFKQGGPLTHIACITNGMAKVYLEGSKNKSIILKILRPTELVGGPGFQVDNRHHFSVSAIAPTKACFIDINAFAGLLNTSNPFAKEFISHLNNATIHLYNKLQNLTQKQMHGRIAEALVYLSENIFGNGKITNVITRQGIADFTSLSKDSAIRILKEFERDKIISLPNGGIEILDNKKLHDISVRG